MFAAAPTNIFEEKLRGIALFPLRAN